MPPAPSSRMIWYRGPNDWPTPNGPETAGRGVSDATLRPGIPPRLDPDCACLMSAPERSVAAAPAISTSGGKPAPARASAADAATARGRRVMPSGGEPTGGGVMTPVVTLGVAARQIVQRPDGEGVSRPQTRHFMG